MQKVALIHSLKIRQASLFGKSELEVNEQNSYKKPKLPHLSSAISWNGFLQELLTAWKIKQNKYLQ